MTNLTGIFGVLALAGVFLFNQSISAQPNEGGGAIVAIDEAAGSSGSGSQGRSPDKIFGSTKTKAGTKTVSKTKTRSTRIAVQKKPGKWDGFVVGDKYSFLNFEVVSAAKPYHTRAAKTGGASGLVQVEVLIDQFGNVLTARARTGNKLLHPEAERAALESKFNRPAVYGKPARAIGFLVYRFGQPTAEE